MIDLSPEAIILLTNIIVVTFGYGGLHVKMTRLVRDVEKLDAAIHNGLSSDVTAMKVALSAMQAICNERAHTRDKE